MTDRPYTKAFAMVVASVALIEFESGSDKSRPTGYKVVGWTLSSWDEEGRELSAEMFE